MYAQNSNAYLHDHSDSSASTESIGSSDSLVQGYSIGGPRAQSGLPIIFIWPEEEYAGCTFALNCSCTNKFVHKAATLARVSQKEKRETQ